MATLESFNPAWGDQAEWDRAFDQIDNYLRAHRLGGRWRRAQLAATILERVASRSPPDPSCSLVSLAIQETDLAMAAWFRRLLPETPLPDDRQALSTGRLALLLCDGYARWPEYFLSEEPPEEMKQAMRNVIIKAGPGINKGRMVPGPRNWGVVAGWFGETLVTLDRRPYLKALLAWVFTALVLFYLFLITR